MKYKMNWSNLLSAKRERPSKSKPEPYRNCFDMDYQRVIPSSSLRRLQDKTQVFPLQENDFTRTRLTHSLEVSSLGRSIGAQVAARLFELKEINEEEKNMIPSLLAVCGLVHDLGNPPFGHYGEDVIKDWFKKYSSITQEFKNENFKDFENFDGNAQTIRILSKLQYMKDAYGMNFCYGTLATLIKYPNGKDGRVPYFSSEKELFEDIITTTGMKQQDTIYRHPATYLLEAADDIAYLFADLEDAVKKDQTIFQEILLLIKKEKDKIFNDEDLKYKDFTDSINNFELLCDKMPYSDIISTQILSLRVFFQGYCINKICDEFINSYKKIMNGKYEGALYNCDSLKNIIGDNGIIRDLCKRYAYQNKEVLKLEIIGNKVLTTLLDVLVNAALDENCEKTKKECGKLYSIISSNFKFIQHIQKDNSYKDVLDKYERIQLVVDYVSGMTDSYAFNLHQIIQGMRLP